MTTARDVARVFEAIAPIESGIPGDQLGFLYGDPDREIRGVACLWNVHAEASKPALRRGWICSFVTRRSGSIRRRALGTMDLALTRLRPTACAARCSIATGWWSTVATRTGMHCGSMVLPTRP